MPGQSDQYATSSNLETRMSIYRYSANSMTLSEWVAERIAVEPGFRILELGCGTGELWNSLAGKCRGCRVLLSDASEGMLATARANLGSERYSYAVIDFHAIPYPANTFDIVISNHNLYHATDLHRVLSEIARVLKPTGTLYATTNSRDHLSELRSLLRLSDDALWPNGILTSVFGAETGEGILAEHFERVERAWYENELRIDRLEPIIDYFGSVQNQTIRVLIDDHRERIQGSFDTSVRESGALSVHSKACLFSCSTASIGRRSR